MPLKNRFSLPSIFLSALSLVAIIGSLSISFSAKAQSNYPNYKFPWRAGEVWQQRPYDIHRDVNGLAIDFVPVSGTLDIVAMAPGRVTRGCTTSDGEQTLIWVQTISRGQDYGERVGYFHLSPKSLTVESGDMVRQGEVLGQIATNLKDYSNDNCNLMSWFEPHIHISLPESAFPITIDGQTFRKPESEIIFSGPVDKSEEIYKGTNYNSSNAINRIWGGLFVGARVNVAAGFTNVRGEAAGSSVGRVNQGTLGKIIAGPVEATLGQNEYTWWQVAWDDGTTGWSAQDFISPRRAMAYGSGINVRRLPAQNKVGVINYGQTGTVSSQAVSAEINGINYEWVQIHWDDGSVGWSVLDSNFVRIV